MIINKQNLPFRLIPFVVFMLLLFPGITAAAGLLSGSNSAANQLSIQRLAVADSGSFRIVFYNAENLFNPSDDPDKDDEAFTPEGERRWSFYRLNHKLNNIYKAIAAAGGWNMPALIGLCEVEDSHVLRMLISNTGFKNSGYEIIHRNSADSRGIDVAALYRPGDFDLLDKQFKHIDFPFIDQGNTRDILYIKGVAVSTDTLHIFINHWPSRWGGQAASEPGRNYVAGVLRSMTDSILFNDHHAKIVIMGDFNDEPEDESLLIHLGAGIDFSSPESGKLYNISHKATRKSQGSYKYQGVWSIFDQFIVSGSLLNGTSGLRTTPQSARVFSAGFLMVPDDSWFGYKPFRTYEGFRYTGGFSDHLPVVLDLWWEH